MTLEILDRRVLEPHASLEEPLPMSADQPAFKSDLLRTMQARGYIHQITHPVELDEAASKGIITAYIGFDATAASLHVGSLIQIMMLRRLQQAGHKPIVLMGGGTTKVGDPTDKDQSRPLLTEAQIQSNIDNIKTVFAKFLTFGDGPTDAVMVDNDEWLSKLGYVQFLREFGVHFTINRMLSFESVKLRLEREQPMTFLEFNYMLMQATDFLELERKFGCTLQMGGSDQWGNILNGVELIRRVDQKPSFGLTTPLLSTASGQKMGKTVGGAVWLNEDMLDSYDYWQFWRNTEDADVGRFMRLFTDLPLGIIKNYEELEGAEINDAKVVLAHEATRMMHGEEKALAAHAKARRVHEEGKVSETVQTVEFEWGNYEKRSAAALVKAAELANSLKEANVLIANGIVSVNSHITTSERHYSKADLLPGAGIFEIRVGKKRIRHLKPI